METVGINTLIEKYVNQYGEKHRKLIRDALLFAYDMNHNHCIELNLDKYMEDLFENVK